MTLEDVSVNMDKLNAFVSKFEEYMATTPHPEESYIADDEKREYAPVNMLKELKEMQRTGRINTDFQRSLYFDLVIGHSK